jgi:hypothetical protein
METRQPLKIFRRGLLFLPGAKPFGDKQFF